jgi:hypothetical protein
LFKNIISLKNNHNLKGELMDFYLLNCRPLRITPIIDLPNNSTLAIYTAFNPDCLICCEVIFLYTEDDIIQCMMFEETPRLLDPHDDADILDIFDNLIQNNNFIEAKLPKNIADYITNNSLRLMQQLITH